MEVPGKIKKKRLMDGKESWTKEKSSCWEVVGKLLGSCWEVVIKLLGSCWKVVVLFQRSENWILKSKGKIKLLKGS